MLTNTINLLFNFNNTFIIIFVQIKETTLTSATHTASTEAKYYVTVVAYNRALEPSNPVCSDGITVDTTKHTVREVSISGARVVGGLVTDGTNHWVLGNDRTLRQIDGVTSECG